MDNQTHGRTADPTQVLLDAATRVCTHARLTLELISKHVANVGYQPPTDYQISVTARVAKTFVTTVTDQYLALAAASDARMTVCGSEVTLTHIGSALIEAALARADEHWIAQALRIGADGSTIQLLPDEDTEEAELTFALLQAVNRRIDAQGEPLMVEEDIDYRSLERLVWRIAAEVRAVLKRRIDDVDDVDRVLTLAAKKFLGPRRRRRSTAPELVAKRLLQTDSDFSGLLLATLSRAQPRLFCALVAARLELPVTHVMPALTQPERLAVLLRATGLSDQGMVTVLSKLSLPLRLDDSRLIAIVEGYRTLKSQATIEMLRQLKLDAHYRAAIFEKEREVFQ